jgi:Ribonuclease G/E
VVGAGRDAAAKDGGDSGSAASKQADKDTDDRDREVREAMAKGGTRAAAKRGGGQGRSGNRRQQRPGGVPEEVRRAILEGPPRTMLVTSLEDRTQIAVLEDRTVVEHYVTRTDDVTLVGNIYMARVQNVLPGMEAAFLDIGKGRNGVLYAGEVLYDELDLEEGAAERIENVLKPGQQVLVQVTKDPMGSKGPRLTMHLSLAGRFMVLAPNSDLFGISRKLTDKERDRLRKLVKAVKPDHHGVIVRTAAEGATEEQITADVERLLAKWARVEERAKEAKALSAVYEEPPLVVKVIRDNFGPEFERCIVDSEELYHQVREYLEEVAPELLDKVELYGAPTSDARARAAGAPASAAALAAEASDAARGRDATSGKDATPGEDATSGKDADESTDTDKDAATEQAAAADGDPVTVDLESAAERRKQLPRLFDAYDVTEQLRKAMSRKVWLPSGGYLIIETTEAMKVIDVNTGKFTGGADTNLEEVVLKTNLEAADEIVRQLRLRDIGGIIIIDFIDMLLKANQEQVVRRLKRELLRDRTKTRVSDVSQLGLVQMTRKNVSQGLLESFSTPCETCGGHGVISEID